MKTVYITLLVLIGFFAKSQQTELMANTWYLDKVILNGVNYDYYLAPYKTEEGATNFYNDDIHPDFQTTLCNTMQAEVSYDSDNSFTFTSGNLTLDDCIFPDTGEYYNLDSYYYQSFFKFGFFPKSYTYEIEDFGNNNKVLTLTNEDGNKAIYNSGILGASDVSGALQAKIYPNPATDVINIASDKKIANVSVFDASGKVVKTTTETAVNIQNLAKGSYVVSIKYADGTVESRKVIKK